MKKAAFLTCAGALSVLWLFTAGCVERRVVYVKQPPPAPGETVVYEAPPPVRAEVVTVAPGPEYYWVPGYYSWNGRWVWIGGRWSLRPHPHAIWVGPRYVRRGHGYLYYRGYWR